MKTTIIIFLLAVFFGYGCAAKNNPNQPNIVLIFSDDLGWTGLNAFGSKYYETPNLDKLCNEGMKFTQGYASACVCAPSRGMLISGQYSSRNGTLRVTHVPNREKNYHLYKAVQPDNLPFSRDIVTVAEALKSGGYKTGMFGKWHLSPGMPGDHGFDTWIESHGAHFNFRTSPDIEVTDKNVYLTDFMCDHAMDFIEKNKEQPFFLYLPDFLVHKPHEAKQALIEKYKKKKGHGAQNDPVYAAMTESLDVTVGRIYNKLEELGLLENTLIVFTSDNGANCRMDENLNVRDVSFTDNLPLRDGKGTLYEGGIRVPYIFYWKGKINGGTECQEPIINLDLYPTFLEIAGIKPPQDYTLDGISIVNCLKDENNSLSGRNIYWHYPNYGPAKTTGRDVEYAYIPVDAVLKGNYKLLEFYHDKTDHVELYNLEEDLGEKNNLADKMPEKVDELLQDLNKFRKETHARMPVANPGFDPTKPVIKRKNKN